MVETLMYAALGFLSAALLALLLIPALNARAERLARRRVEALFPLSITELNAEKDHLRAEFALTQRRLERELEEVRAGKQRDMEEIGRRAVRLDALEADLRDRDIRIGDLGAELAATRARLAETDTSLSRTAEAFAAGRDTLGALEGVHRQTLDDLADTRRALETAQAELARLRDEHHGLLEHAAEGDRARAELEEELAEISASTAADRAAFADLRANLDATLSRLQDAESLLAEARGQAEAERLQAANIAGALADEQAHRQELERQIELERQAALERQAMLEQAAEAAGQRQDTAEAEAALARAAGLEAERDGLQAALTALGAAAGAERERLLAERDRLLAEIAALRRRAEADTARIEAENTELRRRIDEVADQIMAAARTAPGTGPSPAA